MKNVILPELGEGIEKAIVAHWHTAVGQQVAKDDDVVELVTDKAAFSVPACTSGVVKEIRVLEGQEVNIGETLAVIDPTVIHANKYTINNNA